MPLPEELSENWAEYLMSGESLPRPIDDMDDDPGPTDEEIEQEKHNERMRFEPTLNNRERNK